ncbi:MAG: PAS domain S-box protein [Candidatus Eremiobacteraeota bacterium]|nr:PAS domain S-box protein [Candidatus Eremiobacteraeota bacterium]
MDLHRDRNNEKRLLLVEDNPDHGLLIKTRLRKLDPGFSIEIVETAEDALAFLSSGQADLILSDYELPGMNGIDMLHKLREGNIDIPCIFLTAQGSEQIAIEALRAGASDYFNKEEGLARYERLVNSINKAINKAFVERELSEYRNFLETVIETIPDPVFIKDRGHRWVSLNRALCEMVGHEKKDMLQKSDYDFFPKEEADFFWEKDEEMFRTAQKVEIPEEPITDSKGRRHILTTIKVPLRDSSGEITHLVGLIRDITTKRLAEDALKVSEEKLRSLFRFFPLASYLFKISGEQMELVDYNEKALEVTEGNIAGLKGKDVSELFAARPDVIQELRQCAKDRGTRRVTSKYTYITTGKTRNIMATVVFVPPDLLLLYTEDLTTILEAQQALFESETKYSTLVEQAKDGVVILQDGIIRFANKTMEHISGYSVQEITGMAAERFVAPHHLERLKEIYTVRQSGGEAPVTYEIQGIHKDGSIRDLEITGSLIEYKGGAASMGTIRDITERRRAEQEAQKFVSLVKNSKEFIGMATLEGDVTYVNEAGRRLVGIDDSYDVTTLKIHEFVGRDRKGTLMSMIIPIVKEKGIWSDEAKLRHFKTGKEVDVHITTFIVKEILTGRPLCLATIMLDISDIKRSQQELSNKNQELEGFVYAVSHDLKSPLMSIREYSSLLLKEMDEKLAGEVATIIERIWVNSDKAMEMIKGLQHYARYALVKRSFTEVDLGEIIGEVILSLSERKTFADSVIRAAEQWPTVSGDYAVLYQVFFNLVENALKYRASEVDVQWERRGELYEVQIRDNGIGIEKEFHERLFDVFTRSSSGAATTEGAGIGLAIVKKGVERHGGEVWLESEPGKGSTFFFTLARPPHETIKPWQESP